MAINLQYYTFPSVSGFLVSEVQLLAKDTGKKKG